MQTKELIKERLDFWNAAKEMKDTENDDTAYTWEDCADAIIYELELIIENSGNDK